MNSVRDRFVEQLDELMCEARTTALCLGVHRQDVGDVVNDALVSALDGLARFRGTASLKTWFLKIVRNRSLTFLKTRGKRRHYRLQDLGDEANGYFPPEPGVEFDIGSVFWSGDIYYELARLIDDASDANRPHLVSNLSTDGTRKQQAEILHEREQAVGDGDKNLTRWVRAWLEKGNLFKDHEHPTGRFRPLVETSCEDAQRLRNHVLADFEFGGKFSGLKQEMWWSALNQIYGEGWTQIADRLSVTVGAPSKATRVALALQEYYQECVNPTIVLNMTIYGIVSRLHESDPDDHWRTTIDSIYGSIRHLASAVQSRQEESRRALDYVKTWRRIQSVTVGDPLADLSLATFRRAALAEAVKRVIDGTAGTAAIDLLLDCP